MEMKDKYPLTFGNSFITISYVRTGRPRTGRQPNISLRINPEAYHTARIAAVTRKLTIGKWLEEAINDKVEREKLNRSE